jgi:hypothetical protein
MDFLKFIPQLFFDLIARVVPGVAALVIAVWVSPTLHWADLLGLAAGGELDASNAFAFAFFVPLGVGFVLGHLLSPLGKLLCIWSKADPPVQPWQKYDWLRVHRPDAGALAAKIRAEYSMHFSLAAAFLLGALQVGYYVVSAGAPASHCWTGAALLVLMVLSLYRGHETTATFCACVNHLHTVSQERGRPPDPPWSDEQAAPAETIPTVPIRRA